MNQLGNSLLLQDMAGNVVSGSQGKCLGVALTSALVGSLTITGISNTDGTPASWVIPATTTGYIAAPGSGKYWSGGLNYSLSSASDAGKAIVMWAPQ